MTTLIRAAKKTNNLPINPPGPDARDFSCAVLRFLSSLSSDPSAKDVPPHGRGEEPLYPGNLAVYSLVNFKKMAFMVIRRRNSPKTRLSFEITKTKTP